MIRHTFQLISGIGPWREKDLWARGVSTWADFPEHGGPVTLSTHLDERVRTKIAAAERALAERDLPALAALLPPREHWRLFREFSNDVAYLDIEADKDRDDTLTVASVLDGDGPKTFIRGRNLDDLPPVLARSPIWATFNGSCFDLPVLRRHFPALSAPLVHLDLRFLCRKVGLKGGLKDIEETIGIPRPRHLRGVSGWDAILLWRAYQTTGDVEALRFLVEYNLYDTIGLKPLMEHVYIEAAESLTWEVPPFARFERGDVLYDVTKLVLGLAATERDLGVMERVRREQATD